MSISFMRFGKVCLHSPNITPQQLFETVGEIFNNMLSAKCFIGIWNAISVYDSLKILTTSVDIISSVILTK